MTLNERIAYDLSYEEKARDTRYLGPPERGCPDGLYNDDGGNCVPIDGGPVNDPPPLIFHGAPCTTGSSIPGLDSIQIINGRWNATTGRCEQTEQAPVSQTVPPPPPIYAHIPTPGAAPIITHTALPGWNQVPGTGIAGPDGKILGFEPIYVIGAVAAAFVIFNMK